MTRDLQELIFGHDNESGFDEKPKKNPKLSSTLLSQR